ncbi:MAG: T9SS type A sorting domain-containing protein [Candidatus Stahlbacteria bacterium]|nr:T9SS type A sorting domain-containing protein [Candidatus Stahlbacteria bacterium]
MLKRSKNPATAGRNKFLFFAICILQFAFCISKVWGLDLAKLQAELAKLGNPWIAGETEISKYYESLSKEEAQAFREGLAEEYEPTNSTNSIKSTNSKNFPPPDTWDWRNKDGHNWMTGIRNQGNCSSCWAHAWLATMEARINIWEGVPERDINLSEQFIISCRTEGGAPCNAGSWTHAANTLIAYNGVPDEACFPYTGTGQSCNSKCSDWQSRLVNITDWAQETSASVDRKKEIIMEGPAGGYVTFKEDIFYYKGGVYKPIMGEKFNHGVCFCGWRSGTSENWLLKNSWGTSWGEDGYGWYDDSWGYLMWMIPEVTASLVEYETSTINDSLGNNNKEINPDELVKLPVTLKRIGAPATGVSCTLIVNSPYVTVTQNYSYFGDMGTGQSKIGTPAYELSISPTAPINYQFTCNLKIRDNSGHSWEDQFNLTVLGVAKMICSPWALSFYYQQTKAGEIDTILYDDGTPSNFVDFGTSGYYAVRFTPTDPCSVIGCKVYLDDYYSTSVKIRIYDDNAGTPGTLIEIDTLTIGTTPQWYTLTFNSAYNDENDFWICVIGPTKLYYDAANSGRNKYSTNSGSTWNNFTTGDLLIRAIVNYYSNAADTGEICVKSKGSGVLNIPNVAVKNNSTWLNFVEPASLTVPANDSDVIAVGIDTTGMTVNVPYWDTLIVSSNDPDYSTLFIPVRVLVSNIANTPPQVNGIPNQDFLTGNQVTISLDQYATDTQDPDYLLSWENNIIGGADSLIVEQNADRVATIKAIKPWIGERDIIFKATDTGDLHSSDTIHVIVRPVNVEELANLLGYKVSVLTNPCNSKVCISYTLPVSGQVQLTIYDLCGRAVKTIVNESQKVGEYKVMWTAQTKGIYFYKLQVENPSAIGTGNFKKAGKFIVL